jgi:tetratricopeptide (TPR) repeat protein
MRSLVALLLVTAVGAQETSLEVGDRKLAAGDFEGALAEFEKAIKEDPGDHQGYSGRGRALQMLDRDADAIKDFSRAIDLVPKAETFLLRAVSSCALGDNDAAIADCEKVIERVPGSPTAYLTRGHAFRGKREDAAALMDFDKALALAPMDAEALRCRGETNEALRHFRAAIMDYTRLTEADPGSPLAFALRGYTKARLADHRGALEDFKVALRAPFPRAPDRALHVACARARFALGQTEAAEADAARAVEPPARADVLAERGRYYFDTGRPKEAVADLSDAVAMDPKGQDYARLFLFLGRAKLGERALAAGELKAHLDGRKKRDDWYSRVAGLLCGRLKEEDLFAAAKSENPQLAIEQECEACWYAGAIRLLDGDAAGAKALFERCVATDVRTFVEYESAKMALAAMK